MASDLNTPWQVSEPAAPPATVGAPRARRARLGWTIALVVTLIVLAAGGYFGWKTWGGGSTPASQLSTTPVQRGDIEDVVTATGTLQPRDFVDVGTQVSGQLKKLHVEIGSVVKQGQLLAEIDPTVYLSRVDADRAQLKNQEAQLADKQSQLQLARQQLTRQQNLMKEEATTAEQLQQAEASVRSVTAQIEALRAQMQQTESSLRGDEANLNYTKIYAPMAGTVVSLPAKQGQTLNANQQAPTILRIADLSTMTVQAQVSEADVPKLRVGMDVYFTTLGGEGKRWMGKLRQVNPTPTVVNNVVLYDALFDVPNANRELMTQMTAQVFFVAASATDAIYVPVSALRPIGGAGRGGKGLGKGGKGSARGAAGKGRPEGAPAEVAKSDEAAPRSGAARADAAPDPRALFPDGRARVRVVGQDGAITDREVRLGIMTRVSAQIVSGVEPGELVVTSSRAPGSGSAAKSGGAPKFSPRI